MPLKIKNSTASVAQNKATRNQPAERYEIHPDDNAPDELITSPMIQTVRDADRDAKKKALLNQELTRHDVEADGGNRVAFNAQKQEQYEREQNVKKSRALKKKDNEAVNPYECYLWGIAELKRLGFENLMQNNRSQLPANIEISKVERLKSYDKFGLFVPVSSDNKILRPITSGDVEFVTYLKENMDDDNGKYLDFKQTWLDLFAGETTGNAGKLANKLETMVLPVARINSVSGEMTAHKRVYPLNWFTERIRQIDPKSIIPIWNDAELDTLMIILGRALAGASYDVTTIGGTTIDSIRTAELFEDPATGELEPHKITHTFRSIGILCGTGGTGKSHFIKFLRQALREIGYGVDVLPLSKNQFNWAPAENTDILISDDTTKDDFQALYKSSQLKSIASSGMFSVEGKGIDARPGRAISVCLINSNEPVVTPKDSDSGTESRFEFLQTKEQSQIVQELGSDYPTYLKNLARKNDTSQLVLVHYFLRRCLDKFIETIGYEWDSRDKAFVIVKDSTLRQEIEANRENFIHQGVSNISKLMAEAAIKTQVVNQYMIDKFPEQLKANNKFFLNPNSENNKNFSISHAGQTAEFVANLYQQYRICFIDENSDELRELGIKDKKTLELYSQKVKAILEWVLPSKHFNYTSVNEFIQGLRTDAANNPTNISTIKLWEKHISGFGGGCQKAPEHLGYYSGSFNTAKSQMNTYSHQFKELLETGYQMLPTSLFKSVSKFNSYSKPYSKESIELIEKEALVKQAEKAEKVEKKASKLKIKTTPITIGSNIDDLETV